MFGTPRSPVSDEAREALERGFARLLELFGEERLRHAPVVLPTREFFPDEWKSPGEGVEQLLVRVGALLGVSRARVDLEVLFDDEAPRPMIGIPVHSEGFAGLYSSDDGSGRERVSVKLGATSDPVSVVSTLAHELCHVLLLGDGKIARELEEGEPLTDLLTVFLGFGVFSANAVFRHSHYSDARGQGWQMRRQGYLSEAELAFALALWTRRRSEPKPAWPKHLSGNARAYFDQSLKFLEWRDKRN